MKKLTFILSFITLTALCSFKNVKKDALAKSPVSVSQTPKPVNGVLKGIVELGATGFNFFVINVDAKKNWEMVHAEYSTSLAYEEKTNLAELMKKLKEYIYTDMFRKYKVKSNNIHFIASSGADRTHIVQVVEIEMMKKGYVINHVTSEEEAQFGLAATLPRDQYNTAFVVDMGSSNTKIAYYEAGKAEPTGKETVGAKYAEKNKTDEVAYKDAFSVASNVPAANRKRCYIIGGAPYLMANSHRNGNEKVTTLKKPSEYDYTTLSTKPADQAKAKSGLNIYKAIADATQCQEFIFPWDSDFAIGFLLLKTK